MLLHDMILGLLKEISEVFIINKPVTYIILLILFTLLGLFLRTNHWLLSPPELFIDESDIGYQAYSLLTTQKDYFGNLLPIHPQSFADRRPLLYMLLVVPFVAVLGLTETAVRLPSLLLGVATIPLMFWLVQQLFRNYEDKENVKLGLIVSFITAVLPWHVHYSRIGFELTSMLFLVILGLGFFAKWVKTTIFLYLSLSLIFLILTTYIYSTAKLFIPLLALILAFFSRKSLLKLTFKKVFWIVLIGIIFSFPMLHDILSGTGSTRFSVLSVFADTNSISGYLHMRWLASFSDPIYFIKSQYLSKIFFSHPSFLFYQILSNYLSVFSPQFLIFSGDPNPRHTLPVSGVAGLALSAVFAIGIYYLLKSPRSLAKSVVIALLLISPLPASITREGQYHATRMFFLVLPLILVAGMGFYGLFSSITKPKSKYIFISVLMFLLVWDISRDQFIRLNVYPRTTPNELNLGWKTAVTKVTDIASQYDEVVIDNLDGAPIQTFYAFYSKQDPGIFQQHAASPDFTLLKSYTPDNPNEDEKTLKMELKKYSNDNVSFGTLNLTQLNEIQPIKILGVVSYLKFNPENYPDIQVVDIIEGPTKQPLYYLITNKNVYK